MSTAGKGRTGPGMEYAGCEGSWAWFEGRGLLDSGHGLRAHLSARVPRPRAGRGRNDRAPGGQGSHDHFLLLPPLWAS